MCYIFITKYVEFEIISTFKLIFFGFNSENKPMNVTENEERIPSC